MKNYLIIFYDFLITFFFFLQALNVAKAYVCIFMIFGDLFMISDQFIITFFYQIW